MQHENNPQGSLTEDKAEKQPSLLVHTNVGVLETRNRLGNRL